MTDSASALTSDALYEFLDDLRAQGFIVGTDQVLAAADIVATAPLRFGRSLEIAEYRTLFAPIFSASGEDQSAFYRLFDSWLAGRRPPQRASQPVAAHQPVSSPTRIEQLIGAAPSWPYLVGLVVGLALLFAGVFFTDFFSAFVIEEQTPPQELTLPEKAPVEPPGAPEEVEPAAEPVQALPEEPEIILESEQRVVVGAQAADSLLHALRISLAALPPLLALAWWGWRRRRLQVWLRRRSAAGTPSIRTLGIQEAGVPLFQDKAYRVAFQKLRRHRLLGTNAPDVAKTVEMSLRRGGYFTPVYRARRLLPEYLLLIDQMDYRDQQAALAGELARRLRQEGVLVHVGYFSGDPRFVFLEHHGRQRVDVATLRKRHQDNRLVLITDASGLFHPASGLPRPWIDALESWQTRIILSSAPPEDWGYRERQLHELGFWIFPLDRAGLSAAAEALAQETGPEADSGLGTPILRPLASGAPFPPAVSEDAEAWLEQVPPRTVSLGGMIREVRAYLGESGFRVLAASAVYPQLDWTLTRFLDETLARARAGIESTEARLLALARLPWFRFGRMPDFLRLYLLSQLSDKEQKSVREALRRLIAGAVEGRVPGSAALAVAMPAPRRPGRWLHDLIRSEPQQSPYRDYIFARFIVGGRPSPLDFRLPRGVRQVLSPAGSLQERLPWLLGLPTAALVSVGLWFGFPSLEPTIRTLSQPVSDLIAEATIPLLNPSLILDGHDQGLLFADFSPDGSRIVTTSLDSTARLWDALDGSEIASLSEHGSAVVSAAFSPDGTRIVTASDDRTARLWDATDGAEIAVLSGHSDRVNAAAFSPDGALIVTASADSTARLWDAATGSGIAVFRGHERAVTSITFSPEGALILTTSQDDTARLWEVETGAEAVLLRGHQGAVTSAAFSPDGATVITASEDSTARLWDAETGTEAGLLLGHLSVITTAAFSPDGAFAVTASWDRTARLWDVRRREEIAILRGHDDHVSSASFSPAGGRVITRSRDGTARLWDVGRGVGIAILRGHIDYINSVGFSPDGVRIITGSLDRTAIIWNMQPSWAVPLKTFTAEAFRTRLREEIEEGLVSVIESEDETVLRLTGEGLFASAVSEVRSEARLLVRKVARAINDHPGPIVVTSYPDSVALSLERLTSDVPLLHERANAVQKIIASIVGDAPEVLTEGRPTPLDTFLRGAPLTPGRGVEILIPLLPREQAPSSEEPPEVSPAAVRKVIVEMQQDGYEDPRVRRAVTLAVDWQRLAEEAGLQPEAIVLRDVVGDTAIEPGFADPAAARRLLTEAGYPGGGAIQHRIFFAAPLESMAEALAGVLQGLGFKSALQEIAPDGGGTFAEGEGKNVPASRARDAGILVLSYERDSTTTSEELADLVIEGELEVRLDGNAGGLTIELTVANRGNATSKEAGLLISDLASGFGWPLQRIASLDPGQTLSLKLSGPLPETIDGGELALVAEIDPGGDVRESEEDNNTSEIARISLPALTSDSATVAALGLVPGQFHALVIGNARYQNLPQLQSPAADARAIGRLLREQYGFRVTTLLDATRFDILSALNALREKLSEQDSLVIFYAGHSEIDRQTSRVFWLPADADPDSRANWIASSALVDMISTMNVRHVLVIADAAFSGTLTRSIFSRAGPSQGPEARAAWLASLASEQSRTVIASGGLNPVVLDGGGSPGSVFSRALLEVLSQNQGILPGQELHREVTSRVISRSGGAGLSQVPEYAPIQGAGHEGGEFLFVPADLMPDPGAMLKKAQETAKEIIEKMER